MYKSTMKEVKQILKKGVSNTAELTKILRILVLLIEQQNGQIEDLEDKLVILAEETNVEFY